MIATGIYREESRIRMGYGESVINFVGSQLWVNPLYWWPRSRFTQYREYHGIRRNPVAEALGMSGECLCGAYAHKGEKALVRIVDPGTAERIDRLEADVRAAGHNWGWEEAPPRERMVVDPNQTDLFMPFCRNCEKLAHAESV